MIRGTNKYIPFIIIVLTWQLSSCNNNTVYTSSSVMPKEVWSLDNVTRFEPVITDTLTSNNIYFTVRTGTSYPFQNIWLFATTTAPSGKSITDTLQYMLADDKGRWYGRGFGDVHELNLPYKTSVYFRETGKYTFTIRHGMRSESLKGVYDFGLRIEKTTK